MTVAVVRRPYAESQTAGDGVREAPAATADKFSRYLDLLAKWNLTYNLTAIRERAKMITHHLEDALAVLPFLPARPHLRVLDVGTGGGDGRAMA